MSGRLHRHRGGIVESQGLPEPEATVDLRPLRPFGPLPPCSASLSLEGGLDCRGGKVAVVFRLCGDLAALDVPIVPAAGVAARRHHLWQRSCFECFLACSDQDGYFEVNLCPDGCWNIYRFTGYRRGMRELSQDTARLAVTADEKTLTLAAFLSLAREDGCRTPIRAGLCAVLLHGDGALSYWALDHAGSEPDFHDRRGFLYLPGTPIQENAPPRPWGDDEQDSAARL